MKSKYFILAAMLLAMPSTMMAQQNIQKAFDALLNDKISESKTQHIFERDPESGRKSAQADVYDFVITTPSALERLKDIRKAFDKDKEAAYSLNSGSRKSIEQADNDEGLFGVIDALRNIAPITLAVGDGSSQSVSIGTMQGSNYIYACFADKDDPDKKYRYAYAMEWLEKSKKTQVRLAVTYALRPEARSGKKHRTHVSSFKVNGNDVNMKDLDKFIENAFSSNLVYDLDSANVTFQKTPESWLSEFNNYKRLFIKNPDGNTATHYATSIYKLCKNANMLDADEKKLVMKELEKMGGTAKDELIQNVFEMSIKKLKE